MRLAGQCRRVRLTSNVRPRNLLVRNTYIEEFALSAQHMSIHGIAHYNLRLERTLMEEVRDFYVDVVGLSVGARPAVELAGFWLYAGDQGLLHLAEEDSEDKRRIGADLTFDHIAFESSNWQEQRARLERHSVPFVQDRIPGVGRLQVFFRDPAGNGVELIFPVGEA